MVHGDTNLLIDQILIGKNHDIKAIDSTKSQLPLKLVYISASLTGTQYVNNWGR